MNLLKRPPEPMTISTEADLKQITIERVVKFVLILLENIKQFNSIANGDKVKAGKLGSLMSDGAKIGAKAAGVEAVKRASSLSIISGILGLVGLIAFPVGLLIGSVSNDYQKFTAIKKLWSIDSSSDPNKQAQFRKTIIHAGTIIFLSFEIPCNVFGMQYMPIIAKDFVHRLFHYLASNPVEKFDCETIVSGIIEGESKADGIWARIRSEKGYDAGGLSTQKIFTKAGIIGCASKAGSPGLILKPPEKIKYGYRLLCPNEPEPALKSKVNSQASNPEIKRPMIQIWDDERTQQLIQEIINEVEKILDTSNEKLVEEIKEGFKPYLDDMLGRLESIQVVVEDTNQMVREFKKILEETAKSSDSEMRNICFFEDPTPEFTGRAKELEDLYATFHSSSSTAAKVPNISQVAVTGMGGIGKSQLAKSFANKHHGTCYSSVISINAETAETRIKSFLDMTSAKGLQDIAPFKEFKLTDSANGQAQTQLSFEEMLSQTWSYLSNSDWLLILDNVTDDKLLLSLPKIHSRSSKKHHILVTSQLANWDNYPSVAVFPLKVLTHGEAKEFIMKSKLFSKFQKEAIVDKFIEALQRHPLALSIAIAYMKKKFRSDSPRINPFEKYLQDFQKKSKEVLDYTNEYDQDYGKTVYTAFRLTLDSIRQEEMSNLAIEILEMVSYLDPDDISTDWFYKDREEDDVDRAVQLLKDYSIVSGPPGTINVHRLVQAVIRIEVRAREREEAVVGETWWLRVNRWSYYEPSFVTICKYVLNHDELIRKFQSSITQALDPVLPVDFEFQQKVVQRFSAVLGRMNQDTIQFRFREAEADPNRSRGNENYRQLYRECCGEDNDGLFRQLFFQINPIHARPGQFDAATYLYILSSELKRLFPGQSFDDLTIGNLIQKLKGSYKQVQTENDQNLGSEMKLTAEMVLQINEHNAFLKLLIHIGEELPETDGGGSKFYQEVVDAVLFLSEQISKWPGSRLLNEEKAKRVQAIKVDLQDNPLVKKYLE